MTLKHIHMRTFQHNLGASYFQKALLFFIIFFSVIVGFCSCANPVHEKTTTIKSQQQDSIPPSQDNKPIELKLSSNKTIVKGIEAFSIIINDNQKTERYFTSELTLKITCTEGSCADIVGATKHEEYTYDGRKQVAYFEVDVDMSKQHTKSYDLAIIAGKDKAAKIKIELYHYDKIKDTITLDWQQGVDLTLKDVRYDEKTKVVLGTIINSGADNARNIKVRCKNKATNTIQWDGKSLGTNQKVEVVVANELAAGKSMPDYSLGQLSFNGNPTANLEFTVIYEGGAMEPQLCLIRAQDVQLDLQLTHNKEKGIVTCAIENKGTSEVKNAKLAYKNTQVGNSATLDNATSGNVDLGDFSKKIIKDLPIKFGEATKASFEFIVTYDGALKALKKEEDFTEPTVNLKFFSTSFKHKHWGLAENTFEIREIEGSQEERKLIFSIDQVKPIMGKVEQDQLEIRITPLGKNQKGHLSTSKNGTQVTKLVGEDCKLGDKIELYFCPQEGETKLQFKLEAYYKGKLVGYPSPCINIGWVYQLIQFEVTDSYKDVPGGWMKAKPEDQARKLIAIQSIPNNSEVDWKEVEIKIERTTGTKGFLAIEPTGPVINTFKIDLPQYGNYKVKKTLAMITFYLSPEGENKLSFKLDFYYKGRHVGFYTINYTKP